MSNLKWGLVGLGVHGRRYLDPFNSGGRDIRDFRRGEPIDGVDVCIIATPPASHTELALDCLRRGIGVLLEKPVALSRPETMAVLDCAARTGMPPLLVSSPHLYTRAFLGLPGGPDSTVIWCGPERTDGSASAYLDWAPHAFSMAEALGTDRVITGVHTERMTIVTSGSREYRGVAAEGESPLRAQVETLERLMHGGFDWRAGPTFTRTVYTKLFDNQKEPRQ